MSIRAGTTPVLLGARSVPHAGLDVGGQGGFNPLTLSTLVGWWDLSDPTVLFTDTARTTPVVNDGDLIKGIRDKSVSGAHMSEATNPPTYKKAIRQGLSVGRFNGSTTLLTSSLTRAHPFTVFAAYTQSKAGTNAMAVMGWGGAGGGYSFDMANGTGFVRAYNGSAVIAGAVDKSNTWMTTTFSPNGASGTLYTDGTQIATGNAGSQNATPGVVLGNFPSGGADRFFNGDLGEALMLSGVASATDRFACEQYLRRWGTP